MPVHPVAVVTRLRSLPSAFMTYVPSGNRASGCRLDPAVAAIFVPSGDHTGAANPDTVIAPHGPAVGGTTGSPAPVISLIPQSVRYAIVPFDDQAGARPLAASRRLSEPVGLIE